MKKILQDLYNGMLGSLDTTEKPFSARKLTAFVIIGAIVAAHVKWMVLGDLSNLEMVLSIDYAFVAALFGLTTYQYVKTKNGESN